MKINILTLFPEMFVSLNSSVIGRAVDNKLISFDIVNIRDYSLDKHKKCDDYPFGGGAGMVMTPQPIDDCIKAIDPEHKCMRIYLSPKGIKLNQQLVEELSSKKELLLLCGHYEGVDQRVIDSNIDMEVSIGDYVLTGGELAAMVLADAVCRYVPDVLATDATSEESFSNNLLEYPQYTRPQEYKGVSVPEVLLSGHHLNIQQWRHQQQLIITQKNRPDLLKK